MIIKCLSPDLAELYDLPHGNISDRLLCQQRRQCRRNFYLCPVLHRFSSPHWCKKRAKIPSGCVDGIFAFEPIRYYGQRSNCADLLYNYSIPSFSLALNWQPAMFVKKPFETVTSIPARAHIRHGLFTPRLKHVPFVSNEYSFPFIRRVPTIIFPHSDPARLSR